MLLQEVMEIFRSEQGGVTMISTRDYFEEFYEALGVAPFLLDIVIVPEAFFYFKKQ